MVTHPDNASAGFRLAAGLTGTGFALAGGWSAGSALHAIATIVQAADRSVFGWREILFLAVWATFALSLVVAALALLRAAWRGQRRDIVPGPTLYVAGASLLIIALFMLEAGAAGPAALAAGLGVGLMVAEYYVDVL